MRVALAVVIKGNWDKTKKIGTTVGKFFFGRRFFAADAQVMFKERAFAVCWKSGAEFAATAFLFVKKIVRSEPRRRRPKFAEGPRAKESDFRICAANGACISGGSDRREKAPVLFFLAAGPEVIRAFGCGWTIFWRAFQFSAGISQSLFVLASQKLKKTKQLRARTGPFVRHAWGPPTGRRRAIRLKGLTLPARRCRGLFLRWFCLVEARVSTGCGQSSRTRRCGRSWIWRPYFRNWLGGSPIVRRLSCGETG